MTTNLSVTLTAASGSTVVASAAVPAVVGYAAPVVNPNIIPMVRALAPPGTVIPGIDTQLGCTAPPGGLTPCASIIPVRPTNPLSLETTGPTILSATNNTIDLGTGTPAGYTFTNVDFRGYVIVNWAPSLAFVNCLFDFTGPGSYVVGNNTGCNTLSFTNCTFVGSDATPSSSTNDVIAVNGLAATITMTGCLGIDVPVHFMHLAAGTVTNNFVTMTSDAALVHGDCFTIPCTCGPVTITGNTLIGVAWNTAGWLDYPTGGLGDVNNLFYIRTDGGDNIMGVTVENNIMAGGQSQVGIQPTDISYLTPPFTGTLGQPGQLNNITIQNNYMGYWQGAQFDQSGSTPNVNTSVGPVGANVVTTPNTVYDFSNPIWSDNAWTAYVPPPGYPAKASINYSGVLLGHLYGSATGPNYFVGGYDGQIINCGTSSGVWTGPNTLIYLSPGDSPSQSNDSIFLFNVAEDVIDLSQIVATYGALTFIGSTTPAGNGQVSLAPLTSGTTNYTVVSVFLPGSYYPDMQIKVTTGTPGTAAPALTAANFIL